MNSLERSSGSNAASCFALIVCVMLVSGCSGDKTKPQLMAHNSSNIRKVHNCYQLFIQRHQMTGPTSEKEFKDFLKSEAAAPNLKLIDMDASMVDDMFISERDGEPFIVKYGINGYGPAIVFEAKGVDGARMVAYSPPKEISDNAEYERLLSGETVEAVSEMSLSDNPEKADERIAE